MADEAQDRATFGELLRRWRTKRGLTQEQLLVTYGLNFTPQQTELDHLIPLELGGNPIDVRNLFPEPYLPTPGAREKDTLENKLHSLVCAGQIDLGTAQTAIASDWLAAYRRYVGP
jgi:hypothetical protein